MYPTVAALFVRSDSVYKDIPGVEAYDAQRDARTWPGGTALIAHPPCRGWGRLRAMARPLPGEMDLGTWAVEQVRRYGGIIEHPANSTLWRACALPLEGRRDAWRGWTMCVPQYWWGHRAEKLTFFYFVGIEPAQLPAVPFQLGTAPMIIGTSRRRRDGTRLKKGDVGYRPEMTKAAREHTPIQLAHWLVDVARIIERSKPKPVKGPPDIEPPGADEAGSSTISNVP